MKNIVISTRWADEFEKFCSDENLNYINMVNGSGAIYVVYNPNENNTLENNIVNELNEISGDIIFLFHGLHTNVSINKEIIFDVGTGGRLTTENSPRWFYEKLLVNQLVAFDEVWDYFKNRIKQHELFVLKTSFLDDKIYTNTCPEALPSELSTPELVLLFDPIKGKEFNRNDLSYMLHFEKFLSRLNGLYQDV